MKIKVFLWFLVDLWPWGPLLSWEQTYVGLVISKTVRSLAVVGGVSQAVLHLTFYLQKDALCIDIHPP